MVVAELKGYVAIVFNDTGDIVNNIKKSKTTHNWITHVKPQGLKQIRSFLMKKYGAERTWTIKKMGEILKDKVIIMEYEKWLLSETKELINIINNKRA